MPEASILLIDEEPTALGVMLDALTAAGYPVRVAWNAEEALVLLGRFQPKYIFMDDDSPANRSIRLRELIRLDVRTRETLMVPLARLKPFERATFLEDAKRLMRDGAADTHGAADIFARLRNDFVAGALPKIAKMAGDTEGAARARETVSLLHCWAGIAGTLGLPEITSGARGLEEMLRSPLFRAKSGKWRAGVHGLRKLFMEAWGH